MTRVRMVADDRKNQLLEAAYKIAKTDGIKAVTRTSVANACGVTDGLITRYFGSRDGLRAAVMEFAVDAKDSRTLAACAVVYELPAMPPKLRAEVNKLAA